MDYTLNTYQSLLKGLKNLEFSFQTIEQFIETPQKKVIILRHDVDGLPANSLKMAELEHDLGIPASYYFRAVPESWDEAVIQKIAGMGHEIGYHYENLSACKGEFDQAWADFQTNLGRLRELVPVTTICMHGSPLSKWDNRRLWETYNYRDLGILAEPYFDVDYSQVFYITDTGRKWNNEDSSIRDKVKSGFDIPIKSTGHLIRLAQENKLPDKIMINTHPQRWEDRRLPWIKEMVWQNVKNVVKKRWGVRPALLSNSCRLRPPGSSSCATTWIVCLAMP